MSLLSHLADGLWKAGRYLDWVLPERDLPTPAWTSEPLLKKQDRYFPPLGPRQTVSVCPKCQLEVRDGIIRGKQPISMLADEALLIEATITEESGRVIMRKTCKRHGPIEDLLATDAKFFWRMEDLFPGCDFPRKDTASHGLHNVRHGRGSFLIVDLTTRCNMKCEPCFMNANEIGHVHELTLNQIKMQLDHACSVEPRREVNILFSGGEPTLSPHFLEAVAYARGLGMVRLHAATNGLKFAEDPVFAEAARAAGLHGVYLQLDGVTDASNCHRGIANLFDLKQRALANIAAAGMHTTLQVTVINGLNNDAVGSIIQFAAVHSDKVLGVVFQPLMFTGRDEQVSDEQRYQRRYTLSQLAQDLQLQTEGGWQPMRDWFPMSIYGTISTYLDMMSPDRKSGSTYVSSHPNAAVVSPLVVDRETGKWTPLAQFFNVALFLADLEIIASRGFTAGLGRGQMLLSMIRNYDQSLAPAGFRFHDLSTLLANASSRFTSDSEERIYGLKWSLLICSGMWFQDLFNYELPNIQMSTALVADLGTDGLTPSEVSFSFKTAAGWRQVVENNSAVPTLSEWHQSHGRHAIYANGICVTVDELTDSLVRVVPQTEESQSVLI